MNDNDAEKHGVLKSLFGYGAAILILPFLLLMCLFVCSGVLLEGCTLFNSRLAAVEKMDFEGDIGEFQKHPLLNMPIDFVSGDSGLEGASDAGKIVVKSGDPYVVGKILVIDEDYLRQDPNNWGDRGLLPVRPLHNSLPDELRATNASEVGTIVRVEQTERVAGRYSSGQGAYQEQVVIKIVFPGKDDVAFQKTFSGASPPTTIDAKKGQPASPVERQKILDYLMTLPSKSGPKGIPH